MSAGCHLYFSIGNPNQNVYNGKFFNVSNKDILSNAKIYYNKLKIYYNIS